MKIDPERFKPVEYKVLIKPDEEADPILKAAKASGLHLLENTSERDKMVQVWGELISLGGNAFEDWKGVIPKVGDRVYFAKYAGLVLEGMNDVEYRLCNDKDIAGIEVCNA